MPDSYHNELFFKRLFTTAKTAALHGAPVLVLASAVHGVPGTTVQASTMSVSSEIPALFASPPPPIATPPAESESEPPHQPEAEPTMDGSAVLYSVTGAPGSAYPESGYWKYVSATKKAWVPPPAPSPFSRFGFVAMPWHLAAYFFRVNATIVVVARRLLTVNPPPVRQVRPRLVRWQVPHAGGKTGHGAHGKGGEDRVGANAPGPSEDGSDRPP